MITTATFSGRLTTIEKLVWKRTQLDEACRVLVGANAMDEASLLLVEIANINDAIEADAKHLAAEIAAAQKK